MPALGIIELKIKYPHIKMSGIDSFESGYHKYKEILIENNFQTFTFFNNMIEEFKSDLKFDLNGSFRFC